MLDEILKSAKLRELELSFKNNESVLIEDLWNTPKALVAALALKATGKHVLILTGASQEEVRLYQDFAFFVDNPVLDFPAWETLPTENIAPSPDIVGERYRALRELSTAKTPHIVLSSLQACLQKLIIPKNFEDLYLHLVKGKSYPYEELIEKLNKMGYQRCTIASDKGQFAVRGGIIDIFPVSSPDPFRLEFWDDELESLRIFDPIGQKSIKQADSVEITPAQEMELLGKSATLGTILDYLGPETIIVFDDLLALEDRYSTLVSMAGMTSKSFCSIEDFLNSVSSLQQIFWSQQPIEELSEVHVSRKSKGNFYSESAPMQEIAFEMFNREYSVKRWVDPFITIGEFLYPDGPNSNDLTGQEIMEGLGKLRQSDAHLYILCNNELDETSFRKRLSDAGINLPKHTEFKIGYLSNGMAMEDISTVILPLTEITKRYKIRRQKQRSTYHTSPADTFDLSPGEMIVHYNNGIGQYLGMEKRPNHNGIVNEFFQIGYADNAKLYVPINQAHLITKYIGSSEELPKMHALGGTRWKKTREHAEKAIMGYASELLDLYARRELKGGFRFNESSSEMDAFEEDFPYTETEDQLLAIGSIKKDMSSNKPMDRLVCGDVGYGKTEVCMRAAFKAVADGRKQVAVLVPTTVLAMQHYENFVDRFSNFPVNIGVLSRFRNARQIRETLEGVANGSIDIVIGTHRIISEDVIFKDLGLIIIDEEQRFGVKAKEHLKKIKVGVDCLTLSATPIPRTLYMSLIGARDMSVINTPPQDRLPITTVITESNDQVIKNAILRELARDGQAFIIHNRVDTIFEYAARIQKLFPKARIVVGHGQMHADEIDLVFHAFKSGQADILIATTIIENGIDIPNANTILIDRSDRFGMADLYQLRGRVGRWNRRAYAYFFVPNQRILPEIVRKRLSALAESSGYGGGMKVAMRDLEIRGAGNILGMEQSGQVSSIGFHLYCKLLKRTVLAMQGKIPSVLTDTKIEFLVDARIPDTYISEANLRMEIYQRLGEAISIKEVDEIWLEIKDRFGKPPEAALWLYHMTRVRVLASKKGITLLKQEKVMLIIEKQSGKETNLRKIPVKWPTTPQAMEQKIIALAGL
ncbi:MAG TPA: transcription-repair coupling factor [Parachlamydiaceae bacterium]|nr:transcription-repair coupling factor [Parachlamydiaceae bacterium]